ncbi:MAG: DNA topoisomerase [Lachnospiraceae bacterium]|nr:DNA topoisomerase [Lachnospiraceae bacterium]
MGKSVFIAEKPSVAREFGKALKYKFVNRDGYMESQEAIITWCVGHLVTMSYPEVYDEKYKRWSLDTIPFIPQEYKYEVIDNVKKQFHIVRGIFNREDVDVIYNCGDSGREGEYIQRLVLQMAGHNPNAKLKRVWIDSQTEDEILRGIREAKDATAYDNLCAAAYLRAKEDYLMGINFSRVLTLKYSNSVKNYLKVDRAVISVGRVMTCVLGMIVNREREVRDFVKTPFYRIMGTFGMGEHTYEGEWKAVEGSRYFQSPALYKENGFKEKETALGLMEYLQAPLEDGTCEVPVLTGVERKKETKNPPLLYNLAELQNDCSKLFKISPDETLRIVQELYEKKLTTYPRTDARVLSTAVAKEINKNINGLLHYQYGAPYAQEILQSQSYKKIVKSRYVNDKQITDHYAIIPTGQGFGALSSLSAAAEKVYEIVVRRFLAIFYPPAIYQKVGLTTSLKDEKFFSSFKVLVDEGYLKVSQYSFTKKKEDKKSKNDTEDTTKPQAGAGEGVLTTVTEDRKTKQDKDTGNKNINEEDGDGNPPEEEACDSGFLDLLPRIKKGMEISFQGLNLKEGETSPPKRYNSGSIILTMENAGQFIEDEDLRAQMKGSGIGTSATRAEILKKLVNIKYISLNKKTQILTPTFMGELIYEVVNLSIRPLLNPTLTASWEKGLTGVADGSITEEEYIEKLDSFVNRRTNQVKQLNNQSILFGQFQNVSRYYKK